MSIMEASRCEFFIEMGIPVCVFNFCITIVFFSFLYKLAAYNCMYCILIIVVSLVVCLKVDPVSEE